MWEKNKHIAFIYIVKGQFWDLFHYAVVDKLEKQNCYSPVSPVDSKATDKHLTKSDFCRGKEYVYTNVPQSLNVTLNKKS